MLPVYEQLAEELKDVMGLTIAKFDVEANEVADLMLRGLPTVRLYLKEQKDKPRDFDQEAVKSLIELKRWIRTNTQNVKVTDEL